MYRRTEAGTVAPGATFLIANYAPDDERSHLADTPQLVDAAISLPNSKLQLRLYDGDPEANAQLIDMADDGKGAPFAGNSQMKYAMVRIDFTQDSILASSWDTAREASGWDAESAELGTPGSIPAYLQPTSQQTESALATSVAPASWTVFKHKFSKK